MTRARRMRASQMIGVCALWPLSTVVAQRTAHELHLRPVAAMTDESHWMTADSYLRRAYIRLRAGSAHAAQPELNFNGASMGDLEFIVPLGWTIDLAFSNVGQAAHSARVVRDSELPMSLTPAAIAGAETPQSEAGMKPGQSHTITFRAMRPGRFRVSCAVPAHGYAGMWVFLTVDPLATRPRVLRQAGAVESPDVPASAPVP